MLEKRQSLTCLLDGCGQANGAPWRFVFLSSSRSRFSWQNISKRTLPLHIAALKPPESCDSLSLDICDLDIVAVVTSAAPSV
jgi:hypothetical protein